MPKTLPPPAAPAPAAAPVQTFSDTPPEVVPNPAPEGGPVFDTKELDSAGQVDLGTALEAAFKAGAFKDDRPEKIAKVVKESKPAPKEPDGPEATAKKADATKIIESMGLPITEDTTDEEIEAHASAVTEGLPQKVKEAFQQTKREFRDQRRKLKAMATLEAELAALKSAPPKTDDAAAQAVQKKVDELQAKLTEKENALMAAKAEASDHYRQTYGEPLKAVESVLNEAATDYAIDLRDVDRAMSLTGRDRDTAISDLIAELPIVRQQEFVMALKQRSGLLAARDGFLANAAENFKAQQAQQEEALQQTRVAWKSEFTKAAEAKWNEVVKNAPFLIPNGDPQIAEAIASAKQFATPEVFHELDTPSQAEALHRAAAWPLAVRQIQTLEAKLAAAEKTIAGYKGASPASGAGGAKRTAQTDANGIPENASFEEALNIRMAQASNRG